MDNAPGMKRILDCIQELANEIIHKPLQKVELDLEGFEELMNS